MSGDVIGEIQYLTYTTDGSPPWVNVRATSTEANTNFARVPIRITIYDLRGKEKSVDLDTNAFELLKYEGSIQKAFEKDSEAQQTYYEEIIAILKQRLGASRVVIFNHTFRSRSTLRADEQCDESHRTPIFTPHVDLDPPGARWKAEQMLGKEEAEKAMQNRFQVVNIWRPLGPNPITEKPLTICDYHSLDVEKDVHPLDVRGSLNALTAYTVSPKAQGAHRWCYLSHMQSDEMFLIKIFDSKSDVAQFAFHTAFINERAPASNVEEKSVEVRCLVFYDK